MSTFSRKGNSRSFSRRHFSRTPIAAAVAAALYLEHPLPLYADDQSAQSAEAGQLQEVVVTATRRAEDVQNVPFSIAVIDSDTIKELHAVTIDDIAAYLPGVSVFSQGGYQPSSIIIRGVGNPSGLDPNVGGGVNNSNNIVVTYLGDVPLNDDFQLLDIDRVEALLGPQGTLYGAGTLGGVIRYIPKEPNLSNFEGDWHVRATSQDHATPEGGYDGDGVINVPLIDGTLGFRAVVGYLHDPGYINDNTLVRVPGVSLPDPNFNSPSAVAANLYTEKGVNYNHTLTARAELLYKPSDSFQAELTYMRQETTSGGDTVIRTVPGLPAGPYNDDVRFPDTADRIADLISLVLTEHLGFADLTSASAFGYRHGYQIHDVTDGLVGSNASYANDPKFVAYDKSYDIDAVKTEELRLVSNGQSRFSYIAGLFYEFDDEYGPSATYTPGYPAYAGIDLPDVQVYGFGDAARFTDKAVFGEVGYQFTPAWQVTVGGRFFNETNAAYFHEEYPFLGIPLTAYNYTGEPVTSFLPKFNTSYHLTPAVMAYATVSDGFRNGKVNQIATCIDGQHANCLAANEIAIKPDRTRNFEVGIKSEWFDKHLQLNADYFFINWTNLRVGCTNQYGVGYGCNGSEVRSDGVEIRLQGQLSTHLSLLATYTHDDAYFLKTDPDAACSFYECVNAGPGTPIPNFPRDMGAVHLRYSQNLPGGYAFSATYGVKYQGYVYSSPGDLADGALVGGYSVSDASLGLSRGNWNVSFFVQNALNKYAITDGTTTTNPDVVNNGIYNRTYYYQSILAPRLFGLEFSMHVGPPP